MFDMVGVSSVRWQTISDFRGGQPVQVQAFICPGQVTIRALIERQY
jgi:hypothetical protein